MGKSKHWSGTNAHSTMAHHGGKVSGAGELGGVYGGPGKAAMKTKPKMSGLPFEGGGNKSKAKVMKANKSGC